MFGQGILAGKKTYVVAVMAILGFVSSYLMGDIAITDAAQGILTAVLGMTIRSGITKEAR